jgi:hypothetical protein
MTAYYSAWLILIQQRDTLYLQLFAVAATGLTLYQIYRRLWPRWAFSAALAAHALLVLAAVAGGFLIWG